MLFNVTISEVRNAASKLQAALADFEQATNNTKAAADTLCSMWEGDARNAFAAEQEKNVAWFGQMAKIVETYISALNVAAEAYTILDETATHIIQG